MNTSAISTRVSAFLQGDAGSAMRSLQGVRDIVAAHHEGFGHVVDGSASPLNAARTMNAVDQVFSSGRAELRDAVNAARPGVEKALGRSQVLTGALHADLNGLSSARAILGVAGREASTKMDAAAAGFTTSGAVVSAIDGVMPRLESAAHTSSILKVGAISIGIGATIAGAVALHHALSSRDDDHSTQAPGPLWKGVPGFDPGVDPTGLVL